jgi:hypothetical protein
VADFSTNVGSSGGAAPQPLQPVQDRSSLLATQAVSDIGSKLLSVGAAVIQNNQAKEQQAALNTLVGGFAQKQLAIASATETGEISSQEARMRMRTNYTQYITENPGLVDVLAKTQKEIVSTSGLGSVVVEGTEQEQLQRAQVKKAVDAGWVKANASPDEAAQGVEAYRQFTRHQEDLTAARNELGYSTAQISLQRAKIGLQTDKIQQVTAGYAQQSAKISLEDKVRQENSQRAVGGMADAYFWKLNTELEDIKRRKIAGTLTPQEAIQLSDQAFSTVQQAVNQTGKDAGGEYVNSMIAPMKGLYENSRQFLNGEIDEKVLNTQVNTLLAKSKLNILGDPDVARITATSQLLGPSVNALLPEINHQVVRIFDKNADPSPDTKPHDVAPTGKAEKQDNAAYLGGIKANMGGIDSVQPANKQATIDELTANATNILRSIDVHSLSVNNPAGYNQVTDFLASSEYGQFTVKNGGIYKAEAENAKTILESQYVDKVAPLIQQQYQQALVPTRTSNVYQAATGTVNDQNPSSAVSATSVIKPFFSGGGVVFRADPSATSVVKNKVNDLNKNVAPIVNKLIRMDAHLGGDTNYKASYDRNFQVIFGFDQKDLQPQAGDNPAKKTDTPEPISSKAGDVVNGMTRTQDYGFRPDGTPKGNGFFGELKLPNGSVAGEYSISSESVKVDGKEVDYPTLVPTLTKEEKDLMINDIIPNGKLPPKSIIKKATDFAKQRLAEGKPFYATPEEEGKF